MCDLQSSSIYDLISHRFGYKLGNAEQWLEVSVADEYESETLQIKRGSPIVLTKRITYTEDNLPIEFIRSVFRGESIQFYWSLHR